MFKFLAVLAVLSAVLTDAAYIRADDLTQSPDPGPLPVPAPVPLAVPAVSDRSALPNDAAPKPLKKSAVSRRSQDAKKGKIKGKGGKPRRTKHRIKKEQEAHQMQAPQSSQP